MAEVNLHVIHEDLIGLTKEGESYGEGKVCNENRECVSVEKGIGEQIGEFYDCTKKTNPLNCIFK